MNILDIIESAENSAEFYDTLDAVAEDYNAGKMLDRIYKEIDDDWDEEGADTEWPTDDDEEGADMEWPTDDDEEGADMEWLTDDEIEQFVGGRF